MLIAAAAAIWLRINLPVAVVMVWITNPVTVPPMFFFTYKVGTWMLGTPRHRFTFELSLNWLMSETRAIWLPLLVGSLFVGALLGIAVYAAVRLIWRMYIIRKRRRVRGTDPG
jgi:hypothetical protein